MNTPTIFAFMNVTENGVAYILYSLTRLIQVTGVLYSIASSLRASTEQMSTLETNSLFVETEYSGKGGLNHLDSFFNQKKTGLFPSQSNYMRDRHYDSEVTPEKKLILSKLGSIN